MLKRAGIDVNEKNHKPAGQRTEQITPPGHGRNGAAAYGGARKIQIRHGRLVSADQCPDCERGKVYLQHDPGVLVRIKGQAPIDATVYELERLPCNLCGKVFTAEASEGVGEQKYDASAACMIALLRYRSGFPWNRLEGLQDRLGIRLPAATQCEIVAEKAAALQPAYEALIRQAAQGEVLHNDDTSISESVTGRVKDLAHGITELLVPFFLAGIGLHLDIAVFANQNTLLMVLGVSGLAIISKFVGCALGAIALGRGDMLRIGVGMIPRGEVGMVVAQIGLAMGVVERSIYGVVVAMAIITTLVAPPLLNYAYRGCRPSAREEEFSLA